MSVFLRNLACVLLFLIISVNAHAKVSVSILGSPASGKSYYYKKFVDQGWDDIKIARILTVDILRDDLLHAPFNIKLYEIFKTKDFVNSLSKENPREFASWVHDYDRTMTGIIGAINTTMGPVVNMTHDDFIFDIESHPATVYEFLNFVDQPANAPRRAALERDLLGTAGLQYNNLKRVVRGLQYSALKSATVAERNVVFDETGDELSKLMHRLQILKESGYKNIVIMVHSTSVLTNYMQNAFRMISGSDGGRDSSSSISESYNKINALGGSVSGNPSDRGSFFAQASQGKVVELAGATTADAAIAEALHQIEEVKARPAPTPSTKVIDYLLWLIPADIRATADRINALLPSGEDKRVWMAILKLHIENPTKTSPAELEKIERLAPDIYAAIRGMTPPEAFAILSAARGAASGPHYAGITDETLGEARQVWGL